MYSYASWIDQSLSSNIAVDDGTASLMVATENTVPVVVTGAMKSSTREDALNLTSNAVDERTIEFVTGRNVNQSDRPAAIFEKVERITHDWYFVKEALTLVETWKTPENGRRDSFEVAKENREISDLH